MYRQGACFDGEAKQSRELWIRPHRDEVAAGGDPVRQHCRLRGGQRRLGEDDRVIRRRPSQQRRREVIDVRVSERIQALGSENLRVVVPERGCW